MSMVYCVSSGAIVSGPHALQSPVIRRATSCGNPEVLSDAELLAAGVVPEVLPPLGVGQGYGDPVLAEDGRSVSRLVVDVPPRVPQQVTKRQFYRALRQAGWFGTTEPEIEAAVAAIINSLPEPPREAARIDWNKSTAFLRRNPLLIQMLPVINKTEADLDALFILADTFAV